ncbi:MAG: SMC-Scp complex subunit ScpB, partial [Candidatus Woesearchaeota archaeon]
MGEKERIVEAILFAAGSRISLERIQELSQISTRDKTRAVLKKLQKKYETSESPLIVYDYDEDWKLTVKDEYLSVVEKIAPDTEFSRSVIETLSIIAWKSPILQSDVIKIRSAAAYDHIAELREKHFVTKEKIGRSYLLRVTPKFYEYFDMDSVAFKEKFAEYDGLDPLDQKTLDADFEKIQAEKSEQAQKEAELAEQQRLKEIEELQNKPSIQQVKAEERKTQEDYLKKIEDGLRESQSRAQKIVAGIKEDQA